MVLDSPDTDFEVLRRDLCGDRERDCLSELRREGHPGGALQAQAHLPHSNTGPGEAAGSTLYSDNEHGFRVNRSAQFEPNPLSLVLLSLFSP